MHKIPIEFVREGLKNADGSTLFGVPLVELSKDELIAGIANIASGKVGFLDQQNNFINIYGEACGLNDVHPPKRKGKLSWWQSLWMP